MTTVLAAIESAEQFRPTDELNGADVLDEVLTALIKYVVFPSAEAAHATVLWIAATYAQTAWEHATRLVVKSAQKRSGKTRLLEIIAELAHSPRRTSNISPAALIRLIDESNPLVFLIDEADAIFAKRRGEVSETAEALRGLLNAGHSRGGAYTRWDAQRRQVEECSAFAMAAIAAIGDLPDTIEDRAVVIRMQRRAPREGVTPYRSKRARPALHETRERLAHWMQSRRGGLEAAEPELPVEDRAADVWESLVAVADAAGSEWPVRARKACMLLTGVSDTEEGNADERLLEDLRSAFGDREAIATGELLELLKAIDDAPWTDWSNGRGLSSRGLAELLRPYGIRPAKWSGGIRGYRRADFIDVWTRYTRGAAQSATSATVGGGDHANTGVSGCGGSEIQPATASATGVPPDIARPLAGLVADVAGMARGRVGGASCDNGCGAAVEEPGQLCDQCLEEALAGVTR